MLMSFFFGFMLYLVEKPRDDEHCVTVDECSFPNAVYGIWVVMISFTSVGYGEIYPETSLGKMLAVFVMIFGAFWMALPLTLLGAKFYACYKQDKKNEKVSDELILDSENSGNSVPRVINMKWEWVKDFNNLAVYLDEIHMRIAKNGISTNIVSAALPSGRIQHSLRKSEFGRVRPSIRAKRISLHPTSSLNGSTLKRKSKLSPAGTDPDEDTSAKDPESPDQLLEETPKELTQEQEEVHVAYQVAVLCNGHNSLFAKHFMDLRTYCQASS